MPRIKLEMPDNYSYSMEYKVVVTDINYGNHVGNDRLLSIVHEARLDYFKSLGYKNELDFENNTGIVMADAALIFKNEAFHGDQLIVDLGIKEPGPHGFEMYYRITRSSDDAVIALAKTGIVFYDYSSKKVARIPEATLSRLGITL